MERGDWEEGKNTREFEMRGERREEGDWREDQRKEKVEDWKQERMEERGTQKRGEDIQENCN